MSYDELQDMVLELQETVESLRASLSRKYAHCNRMKKEIKMLKDQITRLNEPFISESQSGTETMMSSDADAGLSVMQKPSETTEQITAFADEDAGWVTNIEGTYDETMDLAHATDSSLGSFLSRPVRVKQFEWQVGQFLFEQFNPWQTFQDNPFVADKIRNYELLRYKLHMKVVISATQFHYGRAIVSYNPLFGRDQITAERAFFDIDVIAASQKPHFWLNPADNQGGEMCLPFFYPKNYLSISKDDANEMGEITFKSVKDLRHANGGDDPVTVSVFLWAEDVVLTMPTSRQVIVPSQAGKQGGGAQKGSNSKAQRKPKPNQINADDEYGQGIISKPAAVIAKAAGVLEAIPAIAPYARATEMVATKIGQVAKIFGFSRPAVLDSIKPMKPSPTGNMANTDAEDACMKLTLDSKQELTIDSRTVGLDGADQMNLKFIAEKESYLTTFEWNPSDAVDSLLWNCEVTPNLFGIFQQEIHPMPMCMLASVFNFWQGSIKFRFQIVKSKFHKGRMLVRYDPRAHNADVQYNTAYSRVIDIASEDDFEIVVGWAQAEAFLNCGSTPSVSQTKYSDSTRLSLDTSANINGILELDVLNNLVSPSADSGIFVNVFVSMCDDHKFAFPTTDKIRNLHVFPQVTPTATPGFPPPVPMDESIILMPNKVFTSQSGIENAMETDKPFGSKQLQTISQEAPPADHQMEVFFGDTVVSIRDLFKRYCKVRSVVPELPNTDVYRFQRRFDKILPYFSGWDPNGINTSEVDGTTKLSVVDTHFLTWFQPCYAGQRGSIRRKFVYHRNSPALLNPVVSLWTPGTPNVLNLDKTIASTPQNLSKTLSRGWGISAGLGVATTNLGVNDTIEVEFPFYLGSRFESAREVQATAIPGNRIQHSVTSYNFSQGATTLGDSTVYDEYVAAGEDFSLFFWTGTPIVFNYAVTESS